MEKTEGFDFWIHTLKGTSYVQKRASLQASVDSMKQPMQLVPGFDPSFGERMREDYLRKAERVFGLLEENQRLRWIFKPFVTKARMLRFKQVNDTDPITLEPIHKALRIYSFEQQKVYQFEVASFAKHLHKGLLHNDGHIPTPMYPRNPLTNEILSLQQTISVFAQCKAAGHTSWSLETFHACRFDLTSFLAVHIKPLRLHALHTTMSMLTNWECIDTLFDFIKSQHLQHNAIFLINVYKWAVNYAMSEECIQQWKKLCIKWYEVDILIDDELTKEAFFREVQKKTRVLCESPSHLIAMRTAHLKSKREAEGHADGSGSGNS